MHSERQSRSIVARKRYAAVSSSKLRKSQVVVHQKAMPITPYLVVQAFEPEVIRQMSLALETVCETLRLSLTDDPNTRLVASKIIEFAQRGVQDAPTLSAMTLKEFKHY